MSAEEHAGLLADPHTWVLFSAIIFGVIVWKKGKQPLLKILDERTARIKTELEEAVRLRCEAQELLTDYQQKHHNAVQTAQEIINSAKETADLIRQETEQKLTENLKRREELLLERITNAETAAVHELRHQAADIATTAAEKLLTEIMNERGSKLVDKAIDELPQRLG
ncbi:MAG: F0F1 ATP synthase subunit B [Alphaproteobacteria bacterium]|nr:F0F1 ATP synthase subunit B [Alphaproteobacteria bacterium]MCK5659601.1 F0F1 ATP synthase subunit B [Alphaproteobacteria bacterium]